MTYIVSDPAPSWPSGTEPSTWTMRAAWSKYTRPAVDPGNGKDTSFRASLPPSTMTTWMAGPFAVSTEA